MNDCEIAIRKNSDGLVYYGARDYKLEVRNDKINIIHKSARRSFSVQYNVCYFLGRLFIYRGVLIIATSIIKNHSPKTKYQLNNTQIMLYSPHRAVSNNPSKYCMKLLKVMYLKSVLQKLCT